MVVVSSFSSSTTFEGLADSNDVRVLELKSSMANTWAIHSLVDFKRLQTRASVVIVGVLCRCEGSDDVVGGFVWLAAVTRLGWVHLGPWDLGQTLPLLPQRRFLSHFVPNDTLQCSRLKKRSHSSAVTAGIITDCLAKTKTKGCQSTTSSTQNVLPHTCSRLLD